jgi:Flp pilus assembly protein TadG
VPVLSRLRHRAPSRSRPSGPAVRRAERGAVAVEAAIVSTMLFTIAAGIVDVSMLYRTTYEVSAASRAGARLASAEPRATTFARDAAQQVAASMADMDGTRITKLWVYKANTASATGEPATAGCTSQCVSFTVSSAGVVSAGTGFWTGRQACAGGTVDSVGVRVQYKHDAPIRIGENSLIEQTTVMRLEQIPATLTCVSS